jgi:quercetin dioxygenase-like cupin family protein
MDALVKVLPDNACPVEHWGYIFRGKVRVEYTDGREEILSAGDAFYIPGGHRPYMLEETELLQLTRKSDHNDLVRQFVAAGLFPAN